MSHLSEMDLRSVYTGEKQSRKIFYHGKRGSNKQLWLVNSPNTQQGHVAKSNPKRKEAKTKAVARIQAACAPSDDFDVDHYHYDDLSMGDSDGFRSTGQLDDTEILEFF